MKNWDDLCEQAEAVVRQTMAELPPEIQAEAELLPYLFSEEIRVDDEGHIFLGLYPNFKSDEMQEGSAPLLLFLRNIEAMCEDEALDFSDEVRLTYLHELGHHLGWDEEDLSERGLD